MTLTLYTMEEAAARLRISRRKLQDVLHEIPVGRTIGRRRLFSDADITRLWDNLPCLSSSTRRAGQRTRATPYAAPTSGSPFSEALELLTGQPQRKNSAGSSGKSNVVAMPKARSRHSPARS